MAHQESAGAGRLIEKIGCLRSRVHRSPSPAQARALMGGVSSIPEEDIPSTLIQLWRERAQELSWKERERLAAALQAVREASMVDDQPNGRPSIACKPTEIEFLTNLIQHLDAAEGVHSGILESSGIGGGFADANIDADRSESESSGEDGHGVSSSDNDHLDSATKVLE